MQFHYEGVPFCMAARSAGTPAIFLPRKLARRRSAWAWPHIIWNCTHPVRCWVAFPAAAGPTRLATDKGRQKRDDKLFEGERRREGKGKRGKGKEKTKNWATTGIEPVTTRTQSEYHTPRPSGQFQLFGTMTMATISYHQRLPSMSDGSTWLLITFEQNF